LIAVWKIPTSVFGEGTIATTSVFIVKIILIFVTIPGLFIVPGVTRADGKDGRKYYIDPPLNPNKPSYLDFLHGQSTKEAQGGALWPAVWYDNRWDDIIMDDDSLRSMVDLEIGPEALNWSDFFIWTPIRKWNNFVNSTGDKGIIFIFLFTIIFIIIMYSISFYNLNLESIINPKPKRTFIFLGVVVVFYFWLNFLEKTYHKNIKNNYKNRYYGRQLENPYSKDSIFNIFYRLNETDPTASPSPIKVCPYGCRLYSPDPPNQSDLTMPSPTSFPLCGDTRSFFSIGGSLNPDARQWQGADGEAKKYDPTDRKNASQWTRYNTRGGSYVCPKKQPYYKWPYDTLCNDNRNVCKTMDTYDIDIPSPRILQEVQPTPTTKKVGKRGESFKNRLNAKCLEYHNKHGICNRDIKSPELEFPETINGIQHTVKVKCESDSAVYDAWSTCPFPENTVNLDNVSIADQRQPIAVWQNIWDKMAGATPRRLGKSEEVEWENKVRYEIVNQNYISDKK
jgi:hypothetical protein